MDPTPPQPGGAWTGLVPLLIIAVVILRNARARRVRMERLWIGPVLLAVVAGLSLWPQPPSGVTAICIDIAALVIGAGLGWWRGRASRFTIDPATHEVTSRVSPAGMLLILGIFGLRYLMRAFMSDEATFLHVRPSDLTGAFLVLAVGVVGAQRVEWFIRARQMIAASKTAAAQAPSPEAVGDPG